MSLTNTLLSGLIRDIAPDACETTLKRTSVLFRDEKILRKVDCDGGDYVFTVFPAGNPSGGQVLDFGRLKKSAQAPKKGRVLACGFADTVQMGRLAARSTVADSEMTELFESTLTNHSTNLSNIIGRAIYGNAISPAATVWSATTSGATATVTFTDLSLFLENNIYDFVDVSSGFTYVVRATAVTYTGAIGGTVDFINDVVNPATSAVVALTDTAIAIGDSFNVAGSTGAGFGAATATNEMVSFSSVAGTGSLHGITAAALPGWSGLSSSVGAVISQEAVLRFGAQLATRGGVPHTHLLMSPNVAAGLAASAGSTSGTVGGHGRLELDNSLDKYGAVDGLESGLRVAGRPVVEDALCPSGVIYMHNREFAKLAVFKKFGPDSEAGDPLLLDRDTLSSSYQITAGLNMVFNKRGVIGTMTTITTF